MSANKYPSIFSCQMKAIVYLLRKDPLSLISKMNLLGRNDLLQAPVWKLKGSCVLDTLLRLFFQDKIKSSTSEKLISKHLVRRHITCECGKYAVSDRLQRRVHFHWQRCSENYSDMSRIVKKGWRSSLITTQEGFLFTGPINHHMFFVE